MEVSCGTMEGLSGAHRATPVALQARLDAERLGLPFLIYRDASGERILSLGPPVERVSVGRGDEVDIALEDERVSRLQAEIERIGGEWTISDDGLSRNGSFLNGERISGRRRLGDGDVLGFGSSEVIFRSPAGEAVAATVAEPDQPDVAGLTATQRKVLIALCRPFRDGSAYATPATNREVAEEVFLSLDAVKGHMRTLFEKFGVGDLPQNQKRVRLVELALKSGAISIRDLG